MLVSTVNNRVQINELKYSCCQLVKFESDEEREVNILKSWLSYNVLLLEYLYCIRVGKGMESSWLNMMMG